jgi:hypothetical protein
MKQQVDETGSRCNSKLTKQPVDITAIVQNSQSIKE